MIWYDMIWFYMHKGRITMYSMRQEGKTKNTVWPEKKLKVQQ